MDNNSAILFVVLVLVVIMIIGVALLSYQVFKLSKSTIESTLKVDAGINFEAEEVIDENSKSKTNFKEVLEFNIYNNNWRDIIISDFGFMYKGISITFIDEYKRQKQNEKGYVVVPARKSISFKIAPEIIEQFILEHNFNAQNLADIKDFVTDNVGTTVLKRNRSLTRVLNTRQKARLKLAKTIIHDRNLEQYKKEHDGNIPIKEHVLQVFHNRRKKNTMLVQKANSYSHVKLSTNKDGDIEINKNTSTNKTTEQYLQTDDRMMLDEYELLNQQRIDSDENDKVKVTMFDEINKKK